ncbi:cytochrome P450 [Nocardioides marmoriginsengisoli]|uniref:Cytochrome P450 n=1 Tax=Nocardioides marmoriginsengisoli TaxID=661483 RepID=A0A3N0CHG2_9ACTN|nr:cytochrome P450 [Nocardioides marmoriginsengisoli]RNL62894.1 cytochrome P450 [Nocardioides marmoriginsengisoli]
MADSFFNPGFFDDVVAPAMRGAAPQQAYVDFAERCPVAHNPDGSVTITRFDDVRFLNQSRDVLGNGADGAKLGSQGARIPLDLDGDEHLLWRRRLNPLFTAQKMAPLEDRVRARSIELLDHFAARGEADVYAEWCAPLPAAMFLSILGLPQEDLGQFVEFVDMQLHPNADLTMEENLARMGEGAAKCREYLDGVLDDRMKAAPSDDILSWLVNYRDADGTAIQREELHSILYLFILAGLDTTSLMLGNSLAYLAQHPDQRRKLVENPEMWPRAIEELLRFDSSVPLAVRTPIADITLPSGTTIKSGTLVNVSWAAANLDPEVFVDPLTVDFDRHPNAHIAFASGFHRCLGSHLARLELRIALEEFHRRIPDYELAPDAELVFSHFPRGPRDLHLTWNVLEETK